MPTAPWKRSLTVFAVSAGALLGFSGTSSAIMPSEQSMKPAPDSVTTGSKVTFAGKLTGAGDRPLSGERVALEHRTGDGRWSVAETVTTNSDGVARTSTAVDHTAQWRFVYRGDEVYDPSASRAQTVEAHQPANQRIVNLAADQAGKPYSYGANGPDSFDCSGLTQYVHKLAGIELPRTSSDQRAALPEVPKSDMRPGDLVFFSDGGSVYHVGIFAGGNQMWAAPESGDVVRKQDIWTDAYTVGRAW